MSAVPESDEQTLSGRAFLALLQPLTEAASLAEHLAARLADRLTIRLALVEALMQRVRNAPIEMPVIDWWRTVTVGNREVPSGHLGTGHPEMLPWRREFEELLAAIEEGKVAVSADQKEEKQVFGRLRVADLTEKPFGEAPAWAHLGPCQGPVSQLTFTFEGEGPVGHTRAVSVGVEEVEIQCRHSSKEFNLIAPGQKGPKVNTITFTVWIETETRKVIQIGTGYYSGTSGPPGTAFNPCLRLGPYEQALRRATVKPEAGDLKLIAEFEAGLKAWLEAVESTGTVWALTEDLGSLSS